MFYQFEDGFLATRELSECIEMFQYFDFPTGRCLEIIDSDDTIHRDIPEIVRLSKKALAKRNNTSGFYADIREEFPELSNKAFCNRYVDGFYEQSAMEELDGVKYDR